MKTGIFKAVLFAGVLITAVFLFGGAVAEASADGFILGVFYQFEYRFAEMTGRIFGAATRLFALLFLIQFSWSICQLMLSGESNPMSVFTTVTRQVMVGLFFWWLLNQHGNMREWIVDSFVGLGEGDVELGTLLRVGMEGIRNIMMAVSEHGGFSLTGLGIAIVGILCTFVFAVTLMIGAGLLAITLISKFIIVSLGVILLGLGGSEHTRSYTLGYIKALVAVGFRLFVISAILAVMTEAFAQQTGQLTGSPTMIRHYVSDGVHGNVFAGYVPQVTSLIESLWGLILQSLFFLVILKMAPDVADSLINGASLGMGSGVASAMGAGRNVAMAAGAVAGAGMMALKAPGAVADAANATKDAASSFSTAFSNNLERYQSQSSAGGSSGAPGGNMPMGKGMTHMGPTIPGLVPSAAKALGATMWQAYRGTGSGKETQNPDGTISKAQEFKKPTQVEQIGKAVASEMAKNSPGNSITPGK